MTVLKKRPPSRGVRAITCQILILSVSSVPLWFIPFGLAWADPQRPKPEWRATQPLAVVRGQPATVRIYGQDLAPKEVRFDDGRVTAKILKIESLMPKTDEAKARGNTVVDVELTLPAAVPPGIYPFKLIHEGTEAAAGRLYIDDALPEIEESAPSDDLRKPRVLPPGSVAIHGQLDKVGAAVFRIDGKAGERWRFEVVAHRLGSPLEPILRLRDVRLTSLRVAVDEGEDCAIETQLPVDGPYLLELFDADNRTQAGSLYRLRVVRIAAAAPERIARQSR